MQTQICLTQHNPAVMCEDDASTKKIVEAVAPTEESCHVSMTHFAAMDWKSEGSLIEILIGDGNNLCPVQIGQILVDPSKRLNLLQVSTANDRQSLRKIKDFKI